MKNKTASEMQLAMPMIVESVTLFNRMEEIREEIARRAYELFDGRGREDGHDQEDWMRAESELLLPVSIEMVETNDKLQVSTEVTGFSEKDISISVEPRRLFISGRKEQSVNPDGASEEQIEQRSMMFFRALDLPVKIDAENAKASFKNGVLKISLPKAAETESSETESVKSEPA